MKREKAKNERAHKPATVINSEKRKRMCGGGAKAKASLKLGSDYCERWRRDDDDDPLTQGKVALVDGADFEWLNKFKWYAMCGAGDHYYAARWGRESGKPRLVLMHREIIEVKPGEQVDHRNGNGCDNQRVNIRIATQSQNIANK